MERDGSTPKQALRIANSPADESGVSTPLRYAARANPGKWVEAATEEARGGFAVLAFHQEVRNKRFPHLMDGVHIEIVRYQDDDGYLLEGHCRQPTGARDQLNLTKRYKHKTSAYPAAESFLEKALAFLEGMWDLPQLNLEQVYALLEKFDGTWFTSEHLAAERLVACTALKDLAGRLLLGEVPAREQEVVFEKLGAAVMPVPEQEEAAKRARRYRWLRGEQDLHPACSDSLAV